MKRNYNDRYEPITTYNRLMTFAQPSQSFTNPEHNGAASIPVSIHIKPCILNNMQTLIY